MSLQKYFQYFTGRGMRVVESRTINTLELGKCIFYFTETLSMLIILLVIHGILKCTSDKCNSPLAALESGPWRQFLVEKLLSLFSSMMNVSSCHRSPV